MVAARRAPPIRNVAVPLRVVGGVVLLHDIANKTCFFLKTCGFYRSGNPLFLSLTTRGQSASDGLDIMADNQNPYGENERFFFFLFQNHTVELYKVHHRLRC